MRLERGAADDITSGGETKKNYEAWELEPHICRLCFGRLASCPTTGGKHLYVCTNCGVEVEGASADAVCCCGVKIRKMDAQGKPGAEVDAGIRCIPNPDPSPLMPNLYVASEVVDR